MRDLVRGEGGLSGRGRQVGLLKEITAYGAHVHAGVLEVVTALLYSQEAPKTDGPPDAGEMR